MRVDAKTCANPTEFIDRRRLRREALVGEPPPLEQGQNNDSSHRHRSRGTQDGKGSREPPALPLSGDKQRRRGKHGSGYTPVLSNCLLAYVLGLRLERCPKLWLLFMFRSFFSSLAFFLPSSSVSPHPCCLCSLFLPSFHVSSVSFVPIVSPFAFFFGVGFVWFSRPTRRHPARASRPIFRNCYYSGACLAFSSIRSFLVPFASFSSFVCVLVFSFLCPPSLSFSRFALCRVFLFSECSCSPTLGCAIL